MVKPEILFEDEIRKLIETANSLRDKAFVAVIFEGGFRISELLTMRLCDVEPTDFGFRVMVSGKTGFRTVPLISSAPLLSLYIENHPRKEDLHGPLWVHFGQRNRYDSLSYFAAYNMIRELAKRAGVKKRIYPHLFRHSAATRDAKFLTEAEMKIKYGWDQSSKMAAVYVHMSGRDLDQKIASIYSDKAVEMPKPEFRPILCPRCNEKNTPGQRYCGRCGGPLNP